VAVRVAVAGATGAIGHQLVPMLVESGHDVVGMTRTPGKTRVIREAAAEPIVAHMRDPQSGRHYR
jgi:uncharacterized protein YbjT (DUF2867 family)